MNYVLETFGSDYFILQLSTDDSESVRVHFP